jgi:hypothetical protein
VSFYKAKKNPPLKYSYTDPTKVPKAISHENSHQLKTETKNYNQKAFKRKEKNTMEFKVFLDLWLISLEMIN